MVWVELGDRSSAGARDAVAALSPAMLATEMVKSFFEQVTEAVIMSNTPYVDSRYSAIAPREKTENGKRGSEGGRRGVCLTSARKGHEQMNTCSSRTAGATLLLSFSASRALCTRTLDRSHCLSHG